MKRILIALFMIILISGCARKDSEVDTQTLTGHIIIDGDDLLLDEVEILTLEDEKRLNELGIDSSEIPNGFHIYNEKIEFVPYKLTEKTEYEFTDINLLYVDESVADRKYITKEKDEFLFYLSTQYSDSPPAQKIPYFVEVQDGKVIRITEEFMYTI